MTLVVPSLRMHIESAAASIDQMSGAAFGKWFTALLANRMAEDDRDWYFGHIAPFSLT